MLQRKFCWSYFITLADISRWWHGWGIQDFDELAGGLIAGHLIECSAFITGTQPLQNWYGMLIPFKAAIIVDLKI